MLMLDLREAFEPEQRALSLLPHPPSPETSTATRRARDYCDCYALLSLVCLLVRTPFWRTVLVDHKRRELALPHEKRPPPS